MNAITTNNLISTVELMSTNLDLRPDSWREQLQAVRSTTGSLEIVDTVPDEARKSWQLPLIRVFQRVAFGDADNGAFQDVADWCLRQTLTLLHLYPEDVEILACELELGPNLTTANQFSDWQQLVTPCSKITGQNLPRRTRIFE
jgi:hypothetical protein